MSNVINFLYSFFAVCTTAFISAWLVESGMITFYHQLIMPPMTPPDNIFPFMWSILYVLMIISYYLVLSCQDILKIQRATLLFLGQLVLHIIWSYFFFYQGFFLYALITLFLLIWTVFSMLKIFKSINPISAYLQYPYLLWLLFAAYLNAGIMYFNGLMLNF